MEDEGQCPQATSQSQSGANQFIALRGLGLDEQELASLGRQGYLALRASYWRLRFRHQGRLRNIYIGANPERVTAVRQELAELRTGLHGQRELKVLVQQGKQALREIKAKLGPALASQGLYYHGDRIRKKRSSQH